MKNGAVVRIIVLMAVLAAFILVSGICSQQLIRGDSEKLEKGIDAIQDGIRSGKWDNASDTLNSISSDWVNIKKTWSALIDHEEIDSIDITFTRLKALLEAKDISSALSEAAALRRLVTHIPEREKPSLENLF
ncbi:MAG: DUF4363 family protein [Clostridiaceae bacterium]|jgi:hypothetical protein|nr:DUF4363 family protein [Clostridiaceae bacterium]